MGLDPKDIELSLNGSTEQTTTVTMEASTNGTMYQQFDIVQRVQDQARKAIEERIDREALQFIKNKLAVKEEEESKKFQELCNKMKSKHKRNRK